MALQSDKAHLRFYVFFLYFLNQWLGNARFQLSGIPGHKKAIPIHARNNVVMSMLNRLHCFDAIIEQNMTGRGLDRGAYRTSQRGKPATEFGTNFRRHIEDISNMRLRNYKRVAVDHRSDIKKTQEVSVFINFVTGYIAGDDPAENTFRIGEN